MALKQGKTYICTINSGGMDESTLVGTVKAIRGNKVDFYNVMLDKGLGEHYYKILTVDTKNIDTIKVW